MFLEFLLLVCVGVVCVDVVGLISFFLDTQHLAVLKVCKSVSSCWAFGLVFSDVDTVRFTLLGHRHHYQGDRLRKSDLWIGGKCNFAKPSHCAGTVLQLREV
jgi:hypothetical protein